MKRVHAYLSITVLIFVSALSCSKDENILQSQINSDQKTRIDTIQTKPGDSSQTELPDNSVDSTSNSSNDPATIKSEVLALFTSVGRTSQNLLKPATGALPSGVSLSDSNILINANGVVMEDYDLRGYTIFINSDNVIMRNNLLGEKDAPRTGKRVLDIRGDVKNFLIEDNDFIGYKGLGSGVTSAVFQRVLTSNENGTGGIIKRNRFKHFGNDMIKTSGGVLIEENVLYAESNLEVLPSGVWDANQTYDLNEVIQDTGSNKHFISLMANNQGNSLPGINNSDNNWQYYDPHCDMVNPYDNTIPSTIRRNLFLRDTQDAMLSANEKSYALGLTNAIRIVRNNSDNGRNYERLLIEENVVLGAEFYGGGAVPIQAANSGGAWSNPTLQNNLIDANGNGNYTHPSTASAVDWQMNYDASTLSPINP